MASIWCKTWKVRAVEAPLPYSDNALTAPEVGRGSGYLVTVGVCVGYQVPILKQQPHLPVVGDQGNSDVCEAGACLSGADSATVTL